MRAPGTPDPEASDAAVPVPAPSGEDGLRPWVWRAALAGLLALTVASFLLPAAQLRLWALLGYAAAALTALGTWGNRPSAPAGWYLLAAGQVMFVTGELLYHLEHGFGRAEGALPVAVLTCWMTQYLLQAGGFVLLIRARVQGRDSAGLLDALIVTTGVGVLVWSLAVRPGLADLAVSPETAVGMIAFPVGALATFTLFIRLGAMGGRFGPSHWLLALSQVGLLASDLLFSALTLQGSWTSGRVDHLGWAVSLVGISCAALHPSMRRVTEPGSRHGPRLSRWRLVLLAAVSLIPPVVALARYMLGLPVDVPVLASSGIVLLLLAFLRIAGLARRAALQHERREMLQLLLRATENERLRMAGDLHDGPVQELTALAYTTHRARRQLARGDSERAGSLLGDLERGLEEETTVLRRLMTDLRPPVWHDVGLAEALRERAGSLEAATNLLTRVDIRLSEKLPDEVEMMVYRVAQECMANVGKHARAQRVAVSLVRNGDLVELTVTDDGVGFDQTDLTALAKRGHFGLVSMQERVTVAGGWLTVVTAPGRGTEVRAVVPLVPPAPPAAGTRPDAEHIR